MREKNISLLFFYDENCLLIELCETLNFISANSVDINKRKRGEETVKGGEVSNPKPNIEIYILCTNKRQPFSSIPEKSKKKLALEARKIG